MRPLFNARRILCLLLICLGLSACTQLAHLHLASEEDEGGIIGTGIMGTITGIGSIYVNGVRVVYDEDLMVQTAFGNISPAELKPGDTVAVEAFADEGALKATSIQRYRPIVAPVQMIADDRSWLQALGVRIELGDGSILLRDDQPSDWALLEEGDWIAVDGLWRDDIVIASNVRQVPPHVWAAIRGVVDLGPDEHLRVGDVRIDGIKPSSVNLGGVIAVKGKIKEDADGTRLRARKFAIPTFSPDIRRVIIEGFTSAPASDGAYTVYGSGLTSLADDPTMGAIERRTLFCGRLDGVFDIERMISLSADSVELDEIGNPDRLEWLAGPGC